MEKRMLNERDLNKIVKKAIKESLLLEASRIGLSRANLESTYKTYNDLGSDGTFNEIFKKEREQGLTPFNDFVNGCATKVSLALNAAGQQLKPTFKVTNGPFKGKNVNTSASGLNIITNSYKKEEVQKKIGPGKTGVYICTPCGFGAGDSGHATVWSWWKNDNKGGPLDDTSYPENNGGTIYFWQVGEKNIAVAKECGYNSWEEYKAANFVCKN